ncbi:MAG: hypothetical protein JW895_16650 [Thermoleophilaceae bacterium]|nr:hypothetical protein [Thermoleophilaceae bacterium]
MASKQGSDLASFRRALDAREAGATVETSEHHGMHSVVVVSGGTRIRWLSRVSLADALDQARRALQRT